MADTLELEYKWYFTKDQVERLLVSLIENPEGHIVSLVDEYRTDEFADYLNKLGFVARPLHSGLTRDQWSKFSEDFRQGLVQILVIAEPRSVLPNAPFVFIFDAHRQMFRGRACRNEAMLLRVSSHATRQIAVCADTQTSAIRKVFPVLP